MIRAVVFDGGETLIDETRQWQLVAERADVPFLTLAGVLGGVIERREDHRRVWDIVGASPRSGVECGYRLEPRDLYPDALPTLHSLREAGYQLGVAGNWPKGAAGQVETLGLPFDLIASSADWGVAKPDPDFFTRLGDALGLPTGEIAYVGDRLDNDVLPSLRAGMMGVFIRRGPWGALHARWPEAREVPWRIDSLTELPALLASMNEGDTGQ